MSGGDRGDVIFAALALSLLLHAGLMFFMKPCVMTRVTYDRGEHARREAMRVGDALPPPESVRMEVVEDIEAARPSPTAETQDLPIAASAETPGASGDSAEPLPVAPPPLAHEPVIEDRPVFDGKIELISYDSASSPVIEPGPVVGAEIGAMPDAPVPSATGAEFAVPATAFAASALPVSGPEDDAAVAKIETPEREVVVFTPSEEVYETVDERVVEAEKEAVRSLVDAPSAADLQAVVACSLATAEDAAWRYFKVTVEPRRGALSPMPKDVVVLIDASGSIGSERLASCRDAAKNILRTAMNTGDRFNLVAFRDRFSYAFRTWQNCSKGAYAAADRWLGDLVAHGRTDVFSTIRSVLTLPRDPVRPLVAVVVTDGDANVGVYETAQIISRFSALNDGLVSIYMYGVKSSANSELINILTRGNRGEGVIHTGARWNTGSGLERFSVRFRDPVVSDFRVVFAARCLAEAYPVRLKNLYLGNTVEIVGRVPKGTDEIAFSLKGLNAGKAYESYFRLPVKSAKPDAALPARWEEERKIDSRLR